jgi:hypothetical protein
MSQVHNVTHVPVHSRAWQILDYEYLARTLARASAVDAEHLGLCAKSAERDLRRVKQLGAVFEIDRTQKHAMGRASDEVPNVLVSH